MVLTAVVKCFHSGIRSKELSIRMPRKTSTLNRMMGLQLKTSHMLMILVLFSCLNSSQGEMTCPAALEGESYTVIVEYNNIPTSLESVSLYWFIGGDVVSKCNFNDSITSCSLEQSQIQYGFQYKFFMIGNNGLQARLIIPKFSSQLEQTYSVRWESENTLTEEDCEVRIGKPVNECLTQKPCLYGTNCTDLDVGYTCTCDQGFSGLNCNQGDDMLHCDLNAYRLRFTQQADLCVNITFYCFVARNNLQDKNIYIESQMVSKSVNWFSLKEQPNMANISFEACITSGAPRGTTQFDVDLQSSRDQSKKFPVNIIVEVSNDNTAPIFNIPEGSLYDIDVMENQAIGDAVVYVNKSRSQTCFARDGCIQVIDIDVDSQFGIESLTFSAIIGSATNPGIAYIEDNDRTSLGYFGVTGQLTPMSSVTFKMVVIDGNKEKDETKIVFHIRDINEPPVCDTTTITESLDIGSNSIRDLGVVTCTDPDVEDKYKNITYDVDPSYQDYFYVTENGILKHTLAVRNLSAGPISFNVTATGYSETSSPNFMKKIPVVITINVPKPVCDWTVESGSQSVWQVGSTIHLRLQCYNAGLNQRLTVQNYTRYNEFTNTVTKVRDGLMEFYFTMTRYVPKVYAFTILTSLGGPETIKTVSVPVFNPPEFSSPSYSFGIREDVNSSFGRIVVTNQIGEITYTFKNYKNLVLIDDDGELFLLSKPPKDLINQQISFSVEVEDSISNLTSTIQVIIYIEDINEAPTCAISSRLAVDYNIAVGTDIMHVICTDPDVTDQFRVLFYSISTSPSTVNLTIDNQGKVTLAQPLPSGVTVITGSVTVRDISLSTMVNYSVTVNGIPSTSVTTTSGISTTAAGPLTTTTTNPLTTTTTSPLTTTTTNPLTTTTGGRLTTTTVGSSTTTTTSTGTVDTTDINKAPICVRPSTVTVDSTIAVGTVIMRMTCTDPDMQNNPRTLTYSLSTSPSSVSFVIDSQGIVTLAQPLPSGVTVITGSVTVMDISLSTMVNYSVTVSVVECPEKQEQKGTFPVTPVGQTAVIACPPGYDGQVSRVCNKDAEWESYSYRNCTRKDLEDITAEATNLPQGQGDSNTVSDIAGALMTSLKNSPEILSGDVKRIVKILSNVGKACMMDKTLVVNNQSTEDFVSVTESVLGADDEIWEELEDDEEEEGPMLLQAMDDISAASLRSMDGSRSDSSSSQELQSELIVKKHIAIKRAMTSGDIVFPFDSEREMYKNNDWHLDSGITAYLPKEAFGSQKSMIAYALVLFKSQPRKFKIIPELQKDYTEGQAVVDKEINTNILSLTVNTELGAFSPNLEMTFYVTRTNYSNPSCGFLDTSLSNLGVWSTRGCEFKEVRNDFVVCECSHLTNFAVLMSPGGSLSSTHSEILGIISIVGCAISIFFLLVTIIVYIIVWKYVKCDRSILHINLCVCLIVAYVIFLAGVNRTEDETVCTVVAALLHYFFLAVFFVMLGEGIDVFISVTLVFASDSNLCKLLPLIYGIPLVIVAISLGVTKAEGYGTEDFCWLSIEDGLLWAFVGPVLLILLINMIILILVVRTMQNTRHMMTKTTKQRTKSVIRTILVLSPLLGVTWVFGVLSVNENTVVFQYLFAIFNTLQGVFIFIFQCLLPPQVRDGFRALRRKHRARSFESDKKFTSSSDRRMSYSDSHSVHLNKRGSLSTTDLPSPVTSQRSSYSNPAFKGSFDSLHFCGSNGKPKGPHRNGDLANGHSVLYSNTDRPPRCHSPILDEAGGGYSKSAPGEWNEPLDPLYENGIPGQRDQEHLRQIYGGEVESLKSTSGGKAARERWKKLQHMTRSPQNSVFFGNLVKRQSSHDEFYPSPYGGSMDPCRSPGFLESENRRNSLIPLEITNINGLTPQKSINFHTNI